MRYMLERVAACEHETPGKCRTCGEQAQHIPALQRGVDDLALERPVRMDIKGLRHGSRAFSIPWKLAAPVRARGAVVCGYAVLQAVPLLLQSTLFGQELVNLLFHLCATLRCKGRR
jgi:hypothetical protein